MKRIDIGKVMSLMKGHPCVGIYTSPHPHCSSSYYLIHSYTFIIKYIYYP